GALLDAEILADVYLAMTGGQARLSLDGSEEAGRQASRGIRRIEGKGPLPVIPASEEERAAHRARLEAIRETAGTCLWQADLDLQ
ncbi:MAG: DNA polymerase III subunit epsilon, partial [Gammaproteobacteria bacterium]